jgi:hypothetical protein
MAGQRKEVKYQLVDHIADIGEIDEKGWGKEVNVIIWGNAKKPVIDIRKWNRESDIMGKGVTLNLEDLKQIQKINTNNLETYFEEDEEE